MTTKRWRLVVNPLSGGAPLRQLDVEAGNWMGALRAARKELGEDGGMPTGASCAVAPDGTVTILDATQRRKFLLTPLEMGAVVAPSAPPATAVPAPATPGPASVLEPVATAPTAPPQHAVPGEPRAAQPAPTAPQQPASAPTETSAPTAQKKRKFQTVAYMPGMEGPAWPAAQANAAAAAVQPAPVAVQPTAAVAQPAPVAAQPTAAVAPAAAAAVPNAARRKQFETVAYLPHEAAKADPGAQPSPQAQAASAPASAAAARTGSGSLPRTAPQLELLFTRDEEPGERNPLTYRERAYLIPRGMSVTEAEAGLRFLLVDLQRQVQNAARGKFVNLAAFDHRWTDAPERPPLVVLEWRDWRGEPSVDYPATVRDSLAPGAAGADGGESDERLADVFEALHELAHLRSAAEGLDFVVKLLDTTVPAAANSACLYDINTDELRFVALTGPGAQALQGAAVPRGAGLFGQAARHEHTALVVPDVSAEPAYDPATDGRHGLEVQNLLLHPVVHDGHLLAMLQLINRKSGAFSAGDVHVVNYVAESLAEFLRRVRVRPT